MSFRKRNEIVGRAPTARPLTRAPARSPVPSSVSPKPQKPELTVGVIPSPVTSQPTVSTGCADLDKILHHMGLPLGNTLLLEESGTTDFTSVLLRGFAAQGVMHNRVEKGKLACHVVVVGPPAAWAVDLPGEYKGLSKEQKQARIAAEKARVSVANMADSDLKIAWRYGLRPQGESTSETENGVNEHYSTQFDITQRLVPAASSTDISFVPLSGSYGSVMAQISHIVESHLRQQKVVRIVLPGFLNPLMYLASWSSPSVVIPFFHLLRALVTNLPRVVLAASLPLDLYPRHGILTQVFESLADGVIHLQPFNAELAALVERAYKNQPAKIQQGLVHVIKVPVLSARGMMMVRNGEYAFKNGRKKFEIEEWGIPVEDEEPEKEMDF